MKNLCLALGIVFLMTCGGSVKVTIKAPELALTGVPEVDTFVKQCHNLELKIYKAKKINMDVEDAIREAIKASDQVSIDEALQKIKDTLKIRIVIIVDFVKGTISAKVAVAADTTPEAKNAANKIAAAVHEAIKIPGILAGIAKTSVAILVTGKNLVTKIPKIVTNPLKVVGVTNQVAAKVKFLSNIDKDIDTIITLSKGNVIKIQAVLK